MNRERHAFIYLFRCTLYVTVVHYQLSSPSIKGKAGPYGPLSVISAYKCGSVNVWASLEFRKIAQIPRVAQCSDGAFYCN